MANIMERMKEKIVIADEHEHNESCKIKIN